MKGLFLLATLMISQTLFAQDFHEEVIEVCEAHETCLKDTRFDSLVKVIPVENRYGRIVGAQLSSDWRLSDTVHPKASLCYQGDQDKLCEMIDMMTGWESEPGGHVLVSKLVCEKKEEKIQIQFTAKWEMASESEDIRYILEPCR